MRLQVVLLATGAMAAACGPSPGTDHSQSLLIANAPSGYTLNMSASGPLATSSAAAQVTTASATDTRPQLDQNGFSGGYARVWTGNGGFLTVIALDFSTVSGATAFRNFEVKALRTSGTVYASSDPAIPGSTVYVLTGTTHAGNADLFCDGVWMSDRITVIDAVTCSPTPGSADLAEQVATQEYQMARQVNGG